MRLSGIQRGVAYPARRDTYPAACHDFSKTQEDSRGLQGNGEDNELACNSLPRSALTTKVARRRRFSKRAAAGSIPAAGQRPSPCLGCAPSLTLGSGFDSLRLTVRLA